MGTAPTEEVKAAACRLQPGRALDLACGGGRHAIWLATEGWQVTAVDRNAEAIAGIRRECPAVDARVVDLEADTSVLDRASFELVVCWLYFQRELYPMIREAVRPGGIAALCSLLEGRFACGPGELRSYFPGWEVLHEAETGHSGRRASQLIVRRV